MLRTMTALLLVAWLGTCSAQQELLHKYLEVQHQRIHFNGVVLVTQNNQVLYQAHIGQANRELDIAMHPDAVFKVASITKQFTAALVVQAAQEGKLRLHDSLALFFPDLKDPQWKRINIHQLLSHTSGIPHNEGITGYWAVKSQQAFATEQALAEIFAMKLLFEPGAGIKYSSPGYYLLASILEKVYRQSYAAILSKKILRPLQMAHTGVFSTGAIVKGAPSAYHLLNDSLITAPYRDASLMKGSGDLYSTAADLATWNNSFATNSIWSDTMQKLLFTVHTSKAPYYGYGWFIRPGTRQAFYHGGGNFGCSAISAWYPQEKLSIVILSNVSTLPVNEIWNDIEKIVFREPFELPVVHQVLQMDQAQLQKFTGSYVHDEQELNIVLSGEQLYAKLGSNPPFPIYPESGYSFFAKKVNGAFNFKADSAGNIVSLQAVVKDRTYQFNKK